MCFKLQGLLWINLLFFFSCQEDIKEQECLSYKPSKPLDTYIYPIVPGTPAWIALETGAEKYQVTQLPDSILTEISTDGLVQSCIDYPLLSNMLAWPTLQRGVSAILDIFNGFQALEKRADAGEVLLSRYQEMDPFCVQLISDLNEQGSFTLTIGLLEAVISQDTYLQKLTESQRESLLESALNFYSIKQKHPSHYGNFSLKTNIIIMARVMILAEYVPFINAIAQDDYLRVYVEEIELQG